MDWELFKSEYMEWLAGPIVFIGWVAVFSIIKKYAFSKVRRYAAATESAVDDLLLHALNFPLNLLILLGGIHVMELVMPLPEKVGVYAGVAMKVLLILSAVFFVDQLTRGVMAMKSLTSEVFSSAQGIVQGIVRAVILIVGTLIILDTLGIPITPLLASLGVGSLAIALALKDTLANLFAGIFLIVDKPVTVGQYIRLESGERGYIEDIGLRSTRIRTRRDITIIIPNDRIVNSIINNYHQPHEDFSYRIEIGISYDSDLDHVERVTMEVAEDVQNNTEGAVPGFKPFMRYHTFGESSINFFVNLRVAGFHTRRRVMHKFIKELHKRYRQEGIEIPFPQRTLSLAQEERKLFTDISSNLSGEQTEPQDRE